MANSTSFSVSSDTWTEIASETTGTVTAGYNYDGIYVWLLEATATPTATTGLPLSKDNNYIGFTLAAGQKLYAKSLSGNKTLYVTEG